MFLTEQISSILSGMMKNKLRIFLTMLGVIVGISAVIIIISVGMMAASFIQMYFAGSLGNNSIAGLITGKNGKDFSISYEELMELGFSDQRLHGPLLKTEEDINGKALADDSHYCLGRINGVSSNYAEANNISVSEGRFLSKADCSQIRSSAVISDITAKCCFGSEKDALGKPMTFRAENGFMIDTVIVGIYKEKDVTGKLDKTDDKRTWSSDIYCTYEYIKSLYNIDVDHQKFSSFSIIFDQSIDDDAVTSLISDVDSRLSVRSGDKDYVHRCYRGFSESGELNDLINALSFVFVAAAVLTLIVGGISLMNTMLVIVKERTKEIGTRKALGAGNLNIVGQFLLESVVICIAAAFLGIVLSNVIVLIVNMNLNNLYDLVPDAGMQSFLKSSGLRLNVNILAVGISIVFSVFVGVFFGVYPSVKAAKMQITDALRHE